MTYRILRLPKALEQSGYSRSTLYQRIADGLWTRPVSIGARAVGWPDFEVSSLIAACIAGKSDADIRELVAKLQAQRGGLQ
jgi:prophage regulatory protein